MINGIFVPHFNAAIGAFALLHFKNVRHIPRCVLPESHLSLRLGISFASSHIFRMGVSPSFSRRSAYVWIPFCIREFQGPQFLRVFQPPSFANLRNANDALPRRNCPLGEVPLIAFLVREIAFQPSCESLFTGDDLVRRFFVSHFDPREIGVWLEARGC